MTERKIWSSKRFGSAVAGGWIAMVIWLLHQPIDSVLLREGNGLPLAMFSLASLAITQAIFRRRKFETVNARRLTAMVDWMPWAIAIWGGLSIWINRLHAGEMSNDPAATFFVGHFRHSVHHGWWLVTTACVWSSARLVFDAHSRRILLCVLVASGAGLSARALHQHFVSIPTLIAAYDRDADGMLADAGLDAPVGSATRMIFENRLRDGGASASFALANSLAASLLVGFTLAWASVRGPSKSWAVRWVAIAVALTIALGIFVTSSRSAIAAILCVVILTELRSGVWRPRWVTAVVITAIVGVTGLFLIGRQSEWVSMAPASLQTRLAYWRATLSLVSEHPWFGVGPGNFQAAYPRYRLPENSETIADPHHFWFETLAMGGWPAAIGLLAWLAGLYLLYRRSYGPLKDDLRQSDSIETVENPPVVLLMTGIGLMGIWLYEFATLQLTMATLASDGLACFVFWALVRWRTDQDWIRPRGGIVISLLVSALHLSFSGGWSVPGVAIPLWLLLAIQFPKKTMPENEESFAAVGSGKSRLIRPAVVTLSIVAIAILWFGFDRPRRNERAVRNKATFAATQGRGNRSGRLILQLAQQSPRDVESSMWAASLVADGAASRQAGRTKRWNELIAQIRYYGGTSATLERQILDQCVAAYQRTGDEDWMQAALQSAQRAVAFAPTDESHLAAAACVAAAVGQKELSEELATRAESMAKWTDNPERDLSRQMVLVPLSGDDLRRYVSRTKNSVAASKTSSVVRGPASSVFAQMERLSSSNLDDGESVELP